MNIPNEPINVPFWVPLPHKLLELPHARKIFRKKAWESYLRTTVACRLFNLRTLGHITLGEWANGTQRYLWHYAIYFAGVRRRGLG